MPKVNLSAVEESTGEFRQLPAGGYVMVVTKAEHVASAQYVRLTLDVAEGPCAGFFRESQWPMQEVLSYKDKALGMLKHRLKVLAEANPGRLHAYADAKGGFAGVTEFDEDRFDAFVGCVFGGVVRARLYTNRNGVDREGREVGAWKSPEAIRAGDWSEMQPRDTRQKGAAPVPVPAAYQPAAAQAPSADVYDEDIPF